MHDHKAALASPVASLAADLSAILAAAAGGSSVLDIGRVEYAAALDLQRQLREARQTGRIGDLLILLEHPPTITLGRGAQGSELLLRPEELTQREIVVATTDRGGRTTYHGPGQTVGYGIVDIAGRGHDLHRFVRDLEQVLIDALAELGVTSGRISGFTGVWVGDAKIAAIGVHVRHWVSNHGFALNVTRESHAGFDLIVPCGIPDRPVTCLEDVLRRSVSPVAVREALARAFQRRFA